MAKAVSCPSCSMIFSDNTRLERHVKKAHPEKRKFVNPSEYWHDPGAGI